MTRWKVIASLACAFVIGAYLLCWCLAKHGTVMASSEWNSEKIIVRELPTDAPLWAIPLSLLPFDAPYYRCEFYRFGSSTLFSAQTFRSGSFTAQTSRVVWDDKGTATVYLDDDPVLKCDMRGFWKEVK